MAFQVSKSGDVTVIDVEGQLIVGNRQELKQKVLDELEKGNAGSSSIFLRQATSTRPVWVCSFPSPRRFVSKRVSSAWPASTKTCERCSS